MKNLSIILLCLFIGVLSTNAQERYFDERSVFSMHYLYPELINPGAIGFDDYNNLMLNYRNTWSGFDDAPSSINLMYNGPIADKLGLGVQVFRDNYGALTTTKGALGASYRIESETNKLGLGITAEYIDHSVSSSNLGGGELTDPEVLRRLDGVQFFDVSFGLHGRYLDNIIYGVSLPSLVSATITSSDTSSVDKEFGFLAQLGYEWAIPEYGMTVVPMITVKNLMFTPFHTDLNLTAKFLDDKLVGGLGYTIGGDEKLSFLIGTSIKDISLYYSYNSSTSEFQKYNNGSHELTLGYKFGRVSRNVSNSSIEKKEMIDLDN